MCRSATIWALAASAGRNRTAWAVCIALASLPVAAQTVGLSAPAPSALRLDWRQIGNSAIRHASGEVATGAVDRVWFTDRGTIAVRAGRRSWEQVASGKWIASDAAAPPAGEQERFGRRYRVNLDAFRSEDGGKTWTNLTRHRGEPILGGLIKDIAVSPSDPEDIAVAGETGVWRSMDGGTTWASLNAGLANLPVRRIVSLPSGSRGMVVGADGATLEWEPGQKTGWTLRSTMEPSPSGTWIDPFDARFALRAQGGKITRTMNGGEFWDDVTGNLAALGEGAFWFGITANRVAGVIYASGSKGIWFAETNFFSAATDLRWRKLGGALPDVPVFDVALDAGANQIYAAVDGHGIFAALAPHRLGQPGVVSAADLAARAAAPGALLSVFGQNLTGARSGERQVPLLASIEGESQIQVPFDATGRALALELTSREARWNLSIDLEAAAPAIFVDRDGSGMMLDADSGVMLDVMHPARSGMRVQILATGLGRVRPDWPAGLEAPLDNPPSVVAPVRVTLDGVPLEVTRATLAPGYVGFYLVEVEMPSLVNAGPAEIAVEVNGRASNRVRVYIEP